MDTENQFDENFLANQIKETESKILSAELDLVRLKDKLGLLREKHADSIVIHWRDEINESMRGVDDQSIFTSYEVILNNLESKYHLVASSKIRNSLIRTLTLMYKEGVIGRKEIGEIHYYGLRDLFTDDDSTIVKNEYQTLFENCRSYVENFEKEL